jgi:prepilin-type N-terminal cleavage/methylation domain-containing protein
MRRRGFTLVELLVVIAIVAILASMILPALQKAKKYADSSVCQSNMKQLGVWVFMYAGNWNEYLPHNGAPTPNHTTHDHAYHRNPDGKKWLNRCPYWEPGKKLGGNIMHCPTTTKEMIPKWRDGSDYSYSMSNYLAGDVNHFNWKHSKRCVSPTYLPSLGSVATTAWLFADTAPERVNEGGVYKMRSLTNYGMPSASNEGGPWFWYPSHVTYGQFWGRGHPGNRCNMTMMDGRVKSWSREALTGFYWEVKAANSSYWAWDEAMNGGRWMGNQPCVPGGIRY